MKVSDMPSFLMAKLRCCFALNNQTMLVMQDLNEISNLDNYAIAYKPTFNRKLEVGLVHFQPKCNRNARLCINISRKNRLNPTDGWGLTGLSLTLTHKHTYSLEFRKEVHHEATIWIYA